MKSAPVLLRRLAIGLPLIAPACVSEAAVSYTVPGATYLENFDSLPKDAPSNANIETGATAYPNGWTDDTTTVAGDRVSVPGWYLYHPLTPGAPGGENGFNNHQRLRFGVGANTGSFWSFGSSASAVDMALGSLGSATVAADDEDMYIALRITNNTGLLLNSFTLTFDGEQWRDGQSAGPESLLFDYSTTATEPSVGAFSAVSALTFTAPVSSGTGATGTAVDGNTAGRVAGITAVVTGFSWAPGTDLWLRWADNSLPSLADDGLAIDNVRFSAIFDPIPEPSGITLLGLSAAGLLGIRRRRR